MKTEDELKKKLKQNNKAHQQILSKVENTTETDFIECTLLLRVFTTRAVLSVDLVVFVLRAIYKRLNTKQTTEQTEREEGNKIENEMVAQTKPFSKMDEWNFRARVARFVLLIWFVLFWFLIQLRALYCSIDHSWAMVFF